MRAVLIALVLAVTASAAAAQSRGSLTNDMPTPSIGLPLPHIGLPLPPMGLPLPTMGLPPENARPFDRARSERTNILEPRRPARAERTDRSDRFHQPASIVFLGWPYWPWPTAEYPSSPTPSPPSPPNRATGRLLLSLRSGVDPQIYVDGYYVGLFSDVGGELILDAGAHTIELQEEGFRDARVDVRIPLDGTITYYVDMKPIDAVPLPFSAPAAPASSTSPTAFPVPTTIYVVPGCYVGNVPPAQLKLPAGCDANGLVTFPSR
ncbi:MAG TPA: hypothetical protein VFU28_26705 [Vicinamibacterales bacterium]|nr:hypothetical protein [Vicinamibacterales bacterium]